MKTLAIVQARMGSTRLPGKVLANIFGKPAIWHLFNQLSHASMLDQMILATTDNPLDDPLEVYAREQKWNTFRGNEHDVLDRFYQAAKCFACEDRDIIVRVTGDDILVDPIIVDSLVSSLKNSCESIVHVSNNRVKSFPYGSDVEVFYFSALEKAWSETSVPFDREHVTPYIRNNPGIFPYINIQSKIDYSDIYLSIDYEEDLSYNKKIIEFLYRNSSPPFSLQDVLGVIKRYNITRTRSCR